MFGLKENVIIGKLVPAGTGLKMYSQADEQEDNVYADIAADDIVADSENLA